MELKGRSPTTNGYWKVFIGGKRVGGSGDIEKMRESRIEGLRNWDRILGIIKQEKKKKLML